MAKKSQLAKDVKEFGSQVAQRQEIWKADKVDRKSEMDSLAVRMQEMIQENNRQLAQLFETLNKEIRRPILNRVLALFTVLMEVFLAVIMVQLMVDWIKVLWEEGWVRILMQELILFTKRLLPMMAFTHVP
jgi:hypothetical protein